MSITGAQYRAYLSAHAEGQQGIKGHDTLMSISNAEDPKMPFLVTLGILDGRTNTFPRSRDDLAEKLANREG